MTKEELLNYRKIKAEIESIKQEILDVKTEYKSSLVTDSVTGSSSTFPYTKHSIKIEGLPYNYENKVRRIERKLNNKLKELIDERDKLAEYIYTLQDSEIRAIMTYRFINSMSWTEIAKKIGAGYTTDCIRKKCSRFLEDS